MIDAAVFLGAVIIAVTSAIKDLAPKVQGWVTVAIAALLGLLLSLVDIQIGVTNITPAQGIMLGLGAVGVHTVASAIGGRVSTPSA